MTSTVTASTAGGTSPRASCRAYTVGSYLSLETSPSRGKGVCGDLLVDMYSLCMLTQVIQAREPAVAVTLERSFSGVFSYVTSEMLAPSETEVTRRIT